jgi:hypothetical protein
MDPELKDNLTAQETWIRGLFLLLFAFILGVSKVVTGAVVVMQFLFTVFSGEVNTNLQKFGASLSRFTYQIMLYLTYNSEQKPFPFSDWPAEPLEELEELERPAAPNSDDREY